MKLSVHSVALAVSDVHQARDFYTSALTPIETDHGDSIGLDMHSSGRFVLAANKTLAEDAGVSPVSAGFRGYVLTYIVDQPTDVRTVMDAAIGAGAEPLKPAKKALFGSFSGVFRAPDGAVWKLAASTSKDTAPAASSVRPTETTVILGVRDPKATQAFYEATGMKTDRDYGNKYIDFHPATGAARLCLMRRGVLAKDAGVGHHGDGFPAMILTHRAESPDEVDALLAAAASAGGKITAAAAPTEHGYTGHFADPDGFLWRLTS